MSQRINITIPDRLHERLQGVKETLNISAVCQKALEVEVDIEELRQAVESKKSAAIKRLKEQRQKSKNEWFSEGRKAALKKATKLNYEDFVTIESLKGNGETSENILEAIGCDALCRLESLQNYNCPIANEEDFFNGIIEGFGEFWESVKDEVLAS